MKNYGYRVYDLMSQDVYFASCAKDEREALCRAIAKCFNVSEWAINFYGVEKALTIRWTQNEHAISGHKEFEAEYWEGYSTKNYITC